MHSVKLSNIKPLIKPPQSSKHADTGWPISGYEKTPAETTKLTDMHNQAAGMQAAAIAKLSTS